MDSVDGLGINRAQDVLWSYYSNHWPGRSGEHFTVHLLWHVSATYNQGPALSWLLNPCCRGSPAPPQLSAARPGSCLRSTYKFCAHLDSAFPAIFHFCVTCDLPVSLLPADHHLSVCNPGGTHGTWDALHPLAASGTIHAHWAVFITWVFLIYLGVITSYITTLHSLIKHPPPLLFKETKTIAVPCITSFHVLIYWALSHYIHPIENTFKCDTYDQKGPACQCKQQPVKFKACVKNRNHFPYMLVAVQILLTCEHTL